MSLGAYAIIMKLFLNPDGRGMEDRIVNLDLLIEWRTVVTSDNQSEIKIHKTDPYISQNKYWKSIKKK